MISEIRDLNTRDGVEDLLPTLLTSGARQAIARISSILKTKEQVQ